MTFRNALYRCVLLTACLVAPAIVVASDKSQKVPAKPGVPDRPNIIIIITDDAGYSDFTIGGSGRISTPRIDSIASAGVHFTNGYVSASVCSPSRAGLLTGRYQQRFGHEMNFPPKFSEVNGLPVSETILPTIIREDGYRTIALGKWHLGYARQFHPCSRGFDDFFGFLQGSRSFWPIKGTRLNRLLRDRRPIVESFEYMTDELGKQAAEYIDLHHARPFFMYLSFNAVHTPMHAKEDLLEHFGTIGKKKRRKLAAMTASLDEAVGAVLDKLAEHSIEKRTLLFFINDNGGAAGNASINAPLRGRKGTTFEGGIRVPFIVQWPGHLPAGTAYDHPVISLDIFATAISAAGHTGTLKNPLDGVDLVPFLTGKQEGRPHETLFWRRGENMAVRHLDWKLLKQRDGANMLFDLKSDRSEANDLAAANSEVVKELREKYDRWSSELMEPRWKKARPNKIPKVGEGFSGPSGLGGNRDPKGTKKERGQKKDEEQKKEGGSKKEGDKKKPKKGGGGGGLEEDLGWAL